MSVAVFTQVYNESVNLPIWLRYYGSNFGVENLYVVDRGSTDGSTVDLGGANKISLPRTPFDETKRADFVSSFHNSLLQYYDTVIFTDTDEILVPNLSIYGNLNDYLDRSDFDFVTALGLNVCHAIHLEYPIELGQPILAQRRYARFLSAECKTLISRIPTTWLPGFHVSNHRPRIDPNLFVFHIKLMDFYLALNRQKINRDTDWSRASLDQMHGMHHRWETEKFVREGFFVTVDMLSRNLTSQFEFAADIAAFNAQVVEQNGFFYTPMSISKLVEIPDYLRAAF